MIGLSGPLFSQDQVIEWKLEGIDTLVYQYEQESYVPMGSHSMKKASKTSFVLRGDMNIIVGDSGGFYMEISSLSMESILQDSMGTRTSGKKMNLSNRVYPTRNKHGEVIGDTKDENDVLFNLIFPIPDKQLELWDTTSIPMSFPFYGTGLSAIVHGFNRVYCVKNLPLERTLHSDIEIVDYDMTMPTDEKMFGYLLGDGEYIFDTKNGYFISGKLNLEMAFGSYDSDEKRSMIKSMEMITEMKFDLKRVVKS